MHLVAGLCPDPLGELEHSTDPLDIKRGREGSTGLGIWRQRKGRMT